MKSVDRKTIKEILKCVPHRPPFLFIDEITFLNEDRAEGHYTFRKDEYFYKGHFPGRPMTPGVIMIEAMAQLGPMPLGIFLHEFHLRKRPIFGVLSHLDVDIIRPILPGTKVYALAIKKAHRRNTLKCFCELKSESGRLFAEGNLGLTLIEENYDA